MVDHAHTLPGVSPPCPRTTAAAIVLIFSLARPAEANGFTRAAAAHHQRTTTRSPRLWENLQRLQFLQRNVQPQNPRREPTGFADQRERKERDGVVTSTSTDPWEAMRSKLMTQAREATQMVFTEYQQLAVESGKTNGDVKSPFQSNVADWATKIVAGGGNPKMSASLNQIDPVERVEDDLQHSSPLHKAAELFTTSLANSLGESMERGAALASTAAFNAVGSIGNWMAANSARIAEDAGKALRDSLQEQFRVNAVSMVSPVPQISKDMGSEGQTDVSAFQLPTSKSTKIRYEDISPSIKVEGRASRLRSGDQKEEAVASEDSKLMGMLSEMKKEKEKVADSRMQLRETLERVRTERQRIRRKLDEAARAAEDQRTMQEA